jgi:hypothetical protein
LILAGCASTKILTPGNIDSDIIDSDIREMPKLKDCQFYLSEKVVLTHVFDGREPVDPDKGVAKAESKTIRRTISIKESTRGILRPSDNSGKILDGYDWDGNILKLSILFDKSNNNIMEFMAVFDKLEDRFELVGDNVKFDGLDYQITFAGSDKPYLLYKLKERSKAEKTSRKVRGRKVGS